MGDTNKHPAAPAALSLEAEFVKATTEIARIRRELLEAEARRDSILAQWLTGEPIKGSAPSRGAPIVVHSEYDRFLTRVKELDSPFCCADVFDLLGTTPRTLTRYLRRAAQEGLVRRVARDRYELIRH